MNDYILAIDAGTTSSRAILFDRKGNTVGVSQHEFTQHFPKESWVEHDATEIWETQLLAIREVLKNQSITASQIHAMGITNQRETTILWDRKTGIPVHNAIVWQDRRTASICETLEKAGKAPLFYEKTGLLLDAYFSGTKIKWILDQDPELRTQAEKGELAFGTVDSWLIWNLTQGAVHATDVTNASRTLLFNIHSLDWDQELLDALDIPKALLPKVVSCSEKVGSTAEGLFDSSIPISGIAGDQQAALFGQMCIETGDVKNTYGTGCFCIMNTGTTPVQSKNKMLTTIGYQLNGEVHYALEGSVFVAGAAVQWLRDQLGIISSAPEIEALAQTVENNGGVTFIPALAGLGAPHWDPHATGSIIGITRGTQKGHIARATLEAIAMRTKEIITAMQKDADITFKSLKVDGGGSTNNLLMQIQSNLLGVEVIRPETTETTALGAAFFAGLASGYWPSVESLSDIWKIDKQFSPIENEETQKIVSKWNERISKVSNSKVHE
ncbi:MAG: glycerol kinase GlpK [Flavobacteriaceae bacterium]|nr:glycerol kinase GlpK [Flavobacteriaceae bacterium]MBL6870409.1 glycerol kinase GlpK [Flavobacteriaceae bacterium]